MIGAHDHMLLATFVGIHQEYVVQEARDRKAREHDE
jgi:hypothetical protein